MLAKRLQYVASKRNVTLKMNGYFVCVVRGSSGRLHPILWSLIAAAVMIAALISGASFSSTVLASEVEASGECDPDVVQPGGSIYRFCLPPGWDGGALLVYAHGYVWFNEPLAIPEDHFCFGEPGNETCINDVVNDLGIAFAVTSYPTNGLAVLPAVDDMVSLVDVFSDTYGAPGDVLIAGASEGGLVTALATERYPDVFDGGLATCGPIGSWVDQIHYFGDFRILQDYYFPGLIPTEVVTIPEGLIDDWTNNNYFTTVVEPVIFAPSSAFSLTELLNTSQLPHVPGDLETIRLAIKDLFAYNIMATNDAMVKLGGNPFDNMDRVYSGSSDDTALNQAVKRFSADQAAILAMENYETSARLERPLVSLHTSLDQQVPQWHEILYGEKVLTNHTWMWYVDQPVPVDSYGHCNFDAYQELLPAFFTLVNMVADPPQPSLNFLPAMLSRSEQDKEPSASDQPEDRTVSP